MPFTMTKKQSECAKLKLLNYKIDKVSQFQLVFAQFLYNFLNNPYFDYEPI